MGRLNNDEQFKFLISCIRYSNNGKVDFGEVAKECAIVTKGAAAKRYERMMKAHGIYQPAPNRESGTTTPRRKGETSQYNKKRKHDQFAENENIRADDDDDDEGLGRVKNEALCSSPPLPVVKHETPIYPPRDFQPTSNYPWACRRSNSASGSNANVNTENSFDQFINSSSFESINAPSSQYSGVQENIETMQEDMGQISVGIGADVFVID